LNSRARGLGGKGLGYDLAAIIHQKLPDVVYCFEVSYELVTEARTPWIREIHACKVHTRHGEDPSSDAGLMVLGEIEAQLGVAGLLAAWRLMEPHSDRPQKVTLAVDKGFDAQDFVAELREINVTPNAAQHSNGRRTVVNGRTKRLDGYAISLRVRKRIEEALAKTVTGMRNPRHGGLPKVDW
jgi:hypothetical protein